MTLKLYYGPGSCSLSPHIVLEESKLPYTAVSVHLKTGKLADGSDIHTINPLGYVPVLELADGSRLREGPAIVQYIADQVPEKNLAPANGTLARYRLQEWLTFIGTELHKSFGPLFAPNAPDDWKAIVKKTIFTHLQWVDGELKGRDYLMGEQFTVADAYLFTVTNWTQFVHLDISALTHLGALRDRVAARPAVRAAMQAEGLLK